MTAVLARFAAEPVAMARPEHELDIAEFLRPEGEAAEDLRRPGPPPQGLALLALGAVGVVYGDIGTSPIYAFREALAAVAGGGVVGRPEVLGLLSLLIWTLILIVTVKYVFVLLRADNRGEGGILALYALVRLALGRRSVPILLLAMAGAALFAGDAAITPAISVLSAVEGMELVLPGAEPLVLPVTLTILVLLFMVQQRGTAAIGRLFGPITVVWFVTLGALGLWHIAEEPGVLAAVDPRWGLALLANHPGVAFAVLGAVFLAVTGGEALYADLGHFGRKPIALAWFALVFPALVLSYLGQGAMVLAHPDRAGNPFFGQAPAPVLPVLVVMATLATVIASQAVISGAFSMARGAIQLGFLPRMTIRHTAEGQSGQIYIGAVNWLLLVAVLWLVLGFGSSSALASAYGIAVTGTMILTTLLAVLFAAISGRVPVVVALAVAAPVAVIEICFLAANLTKTADGGFVPLVAALVLGVVMAAWWRGTQRLMARVHRMAVPLTGFVRSMQRSSVRMIPGTAFFLTPDPEMVPSAMLHNIKHNRGLHEQTVFLTVETLRVPFATEAERAKVEDLGGPFRRVTLRFGFMETPNVSRAMIHARRAGLKFDVMATTFFLGRRRPVVSGVPGFGRLLDRLFELLTRFSADPSDFYHLPRDRVVELGERVAI